MHTTVALANPKAPSVRPTKSVSILTPVLRKASSYIIHTRQDLALCIFSLATPSHRLAYQRIFYA
jgi:hypothetical protein